VLIRNKDRSCWSSLSRITQTVETSDVGKQKEVSVEDTLLKIRQPPGWMRGLCVNADPRTNLCSSFIMLMEGMETHRSRAFHKPTKLHSSRNLVESENKLSDDSGSLLLE
jgi:hypothetical protein